MGSSGPWKQSICDRKTGGWSSSRTCRERSGKGSHRTYHFPHHVGEGRFAMKTIVKPLAVVTSIGMFLVLVMGSAVTNTGSEQGCGKSWPLCHGQLIPQFAVATFIEFSHRAVVGVETVLILGLAAVTIYLYRDRLEARLLVPLMVCFLFLQAGL